MLKNKPIRILELFGGIGACSKAFENLGIPHIIVDYVEVDQYAVKSFNAIHHTNFTTQDIRKWDKDVEIDFLMHGSPCQDFSIAGLNRGGQQGSGTRSSLMYESIRIINKLKPKYVLWENVKNLLSDRHRDNFLKYIQTLYQIGYKNYYEVLNAEDYDIPQHRERMFCLSIRKDIKQGFEFPKPLKPQKELKDFLEDKVDDKWFLSKEQEGRIKWIK